VTFSSFHDRQLPGDEGAELTGARAVIQLGHRPAGLIDSW